MFGDLDILLKLNLHKQQEPGVISQELYELLNSKEKETDIMRLFNKELNTE